MIGTHIKIGEVKLSGEELSVVLRNLSTAGWKPAVMATQDFFLNLADVSLDESVFLGERAPYRWDAASKITGDLFFKDSDLFYFIRHEATQDGPRGKKSAPFTRGDRKIYDAIEVGLISDNQGGIEDRIATFQHAIEKAVKESLDGRKTRHLDFDWSQLNTNMGRLKTVLEREEPKPMFNRPDFSKEEIEASKLLDAKESRRLLVEVSQAGTAREKDIIGKKEKEKGKISKLIHGLKESGLLTTEILVECTKTGNQLTKIESIDSIKTGDAGNLKCPYCDKKFSEESAVEAYGLSELGRKMLESSFWQTVFVVNALTERGIDSEDIICNLSESGEEIDIVCEFLGELWLFELKDREFGSGDAHPLNYRQVKYKADKAFIVTTDKVSKDAKRVIEDLTKEGRRGRSSVVYIEGHDNLCADLETEVQRATLGYATGRVRSIGEQSGINLAPVLKEKFK